MFFGFWRRETVKIEILPINKIKPYENNAKLHPKEQIEQIKKSIKEFGNNDPIAIDENNVIIEGHGRFIALKELGYDEVEIIRLSHMTDEQKKAYILAHNKLTMNSGFDIDILELELDDIVSIDMSDFGFEIEDIRVEEYELQEVKEKDDDFFYFEKEEIIDDISQNFKKYKRVEDYVENIMDIPKAKYEFNRLCQGYQAGYNISLLFNPHRLEISTVNSNLSIFEAINTSDKYRRAFAKYAVNVENKVHVEKDYYKQIGVGSGGVQYVNEFPPYLARDIYKKYCKDGFKVLDPCHGWGGRTLGLASSLLENVEYWGCDPSTKTHKGLLKLKDFLKLGDNFKYFHSPFEDVELPENYFDFVFTSPPYFDTERYSDEDTQSWKSNNSYDEWKENFLYVLLDKILYSLKSGSVALLNVGKVRYPIDDDIIDYLANKDIVVKRVNDFSIGGVGIGARTDQDGKGEPFLEFIVP